MATSRISRVLVVLALVIGAAGAVHADALFTFDSDLVGTFTTFSDTNSGLTATFSSPVDPGGFEILPTFFFTLAGNVLLDPGRIGANNIPPAVALSSNATSIAMDFATNSPPGVPFTLTAFENATQVGQITASGVLPSNILFPFPEGVISFHGGPFNSVVLSSSAPDFAIDNVDVATSATSEPASMTLVGLGLALLGVSARRRRRQAKASESKPQ